MIDELFAAVCSLRPGVELTMVGDDIEGITYLTPNVVPVTRAEVDAEITRLQEAAVLEQQRKEAARASAIAKLAALGLDADEVAAILGGTQ